MAPRLKWHKLRRRAGDPPFQRANLVAALEVGAPCEVDLRFTADHHALCIHDAVLDHETTGTGSVADARRSDIEALRQRGNQGQVLGTAPLFLDEVVALVESSSGGAGGGQVQLDVKTPLAGIAPEALDRFGLLLGARAPAFIASGYDWQLPRALADAAPGMLAGFDPLHLYRRPGELRRPELEALLERTLASAPGAAVFYLQADLILAGLDRGVDLVGPVTATGAMVDAWTVDPQRPRLDLVLRRLVGAGVGQITTNDPTALAARLERPSRPGLGSRLLRIRPNRA